MANKDKMKKKMTKKLKKMMKMMTGCTGYCQWAWREEDQIWDQVEYGCKPSGPCVSCFCNEPTDLGSVEGEMRATPCMAAYSKKSKKKKSKG